MGACGELSCYNCPSRLGIQSRWIVDEMSEPPSAVTISETNPVRLQTGKSVCKLELMESRRRFRRRLRCALYRALVACDELYKTCKRG